MLGKASFCLPQRVEFMVKVRKRKETRGKAVNDEKIN